MAFVRKGRKERKGKPDQLIFFAFFASFVDKKTSCINALWFGWRQAERAGIGTAYGFRVDFGGADGVDRLCLVDRQPVQMCIRDRSLRALFMPLAARKWRIAARTWSNRGFPLSRLAAQASSAARESPTWIPQLTAFRDPSGHDSTGLSATRTAHLSAEYRYGADCTVLAAHGGVATRRNRTTIPSRCALPCTPMTAHSTPSN